MSPGLSSFGSGGSFMEGPVSRGPVRSLCGMLLAGPAGCAERTRHAPIGTSPTGKALLMAAVA